MAESLGPLFVPKPQFHLLWIIGLAAVAIAMAIALYALVRGQVPARLGLAGLGVIPGFVLVIANLDMLDRSKELRFCGSCHEPMAPLVAAVKEANGTLASIHYQSG